MKNLFKFKKGQAIAVNALIMVVLGLAVVTIIQVFTGVLSGQTYEISESKIDDIGNSSQSAYSFTPLTNTAVSLGNPYIHENTLEIYNSSGYNFGLGNFTLDYTVGTATLTNNSFNNTALLANYTYGDLEIQGYVKDSIKSSFSAQKQNAEFIPIIALAIITALVLALILGFTNLSGGMGKSGFKGDAL